MHPRGPGGQNVNKTATAAHLHFDASSSALPDDVKRRLRSVAGNRLTGDGMLVIKAQRYRSQDQNRKDAVDRLVSILRRAAARRAAPIDKADGAVRSAEARGEAPAVAHQAIAGAGG